MTQPSALRTALVLAAAATGLSGCVSLFPKTEPAQLYRFGYRTPAAAPAPPPTCDPANQTGVILTPPEFPRESGNDQILTFAGDQAAYVAATRWVAPARNLFEDATEEAFQNACLVRLVRRQDAGAGSLRLRLDIDRFEAVYPPGTPQAGKAAAAAGPPMITVSLKATLMKRGGDFGAEKFFKASLPATDNRVAPIVAAYTVASTQVLSEVTAWAEMEAPVLSAQQDGPHPPVERRGPPLGVRSTSSTTTTSTSVQIPR